MIINLSSATKYPGDHHLLQKWVKAYILPCINDILNNSADVDDIQTL